MKTKHTQNSTAPALPTLILGGNGKTGRRVVDRFHKAGLPVEVGSRSGTPSFDWNDSSNWAEVLHGYAALYVAYYPDLAVPGATEQIRELVSIAQAQGIRRLVLLSGRGEPEAQLCERLVLNSGIPATVVRCAWFNQNFSESFFHDMVLAGTIALPAQAVREPWVDAEDIADVAFAALTEPGHAGKIYELTGPRLLSFPDLAAELRAATGRNLAFVQIPEDDFFANLTASGIPPATVQLLRYLFTEVLDGRNEFLGHGVQEALGREPRDFREFAAAAQAQGVWDR